MGSLLFDCEWGVSGDMIVGALLDLGADFNYLKDGLKKLNLPGYKIEAKKINKKGRLATDFIVQLSEENFDHDMQFLYGDKKAEIKIDQTKNLDYVFNLIDNAGFSPRVLEHCKKMFNIIANAEGAAHKISPRDVVFHELGAMDSIIDIVSIAVCLESLDIDKVYIKNLREGNGFIKTRVGTLPIPTPAVRNMAEQNNIIISTCDIDKELITPTGLAALIAVSDFKNIEEYKNLKVGYGAGKRDYNLPCTLKAILIKV